MKICMLIDGWFPIYGGGQIHVFELCKRLIKNYNCEIDLYTRSLKDDAGKIYNKTENNFNGKLKIYRIGYPANFFNLRGRLSYLAVIKSIYKNHKKNPYHLIHSHAYFSIIPAKVISWIIKIPLLYTIHGVGLDAWSEMKKGLAGKINYHIEKFLLFKIKCDQIITVSSDYLKYKNVNKNITVIPNGVDIEKFDKVDIEKSNKFKILFVGRLNAQKGLMYLIKAIHLIKNKLKDTEITLIGTGEERNKIIQLIEKYNLKNIIELKGRKTGGELIKEYKSSHLFVLPSVYEGQPLTLLEAWAAKLPVIATNVGDNKLFIQNKINGFILEPRNYKQLAKTILQAINSHALENMGLKGYNLVKRKYSWTQITEQTYNIYEACV